VRLRIFGAVKGVDNVDVGARIECTALDVWMPEVGIRAHGICRGEEMTIEVDESGIVEDQHIPGVRLDLGEIEMRLSDLVGLRAGAVLNLGDVVLERCFIRLGATVLAEGRFATSEGKLMLTIDSVL
jgi:flagellar motor switch/type III secretory pathway protein FliN